MILASHAIFGAYGFWLPNDPRGSWSKFVASWELLKFGPATTVNITRSVAHAKHDTTTRHAAKLALNYPPIHFTGIQAISIARGFAAAVQEADYTIYACCILPQHVHFVVRDHRRPVRQIIGHLKANSTRQLHSDDQYPFATPTPWAKGCWAVYLSSPVDVLRAIRYVENNPLKEGKRKQTWPFVTAFTV